MKLAKNLAVTVAVAALALTGCGQEAPAPASEETAAYPTGDFTMAIGGDAGGGWDATGRAFTRAIDENDLASGTQVTNQGGAGGTLALASFIEKDDKNSMLITGSTMVGGVLTTGSPQTLEDVRPAAVLALEYIVLAVPADSPFKTADDFLAALKEDPEGTAVAVGSTGGVDHLGFAIIAEEAGIDPTKLNAVSFKDGGLTSVLNGDVVAGFSTVQQWAPQYESGDLRVLGVTSAEPVPGLDAPTFIEQGIDIDWASWRGLAASKSITDEEEPAMNEWLTAVYETETWQEALETNGWGDAFMVGDEADAYFEEQKELYADLLPRLGLIE